MNDQVSFGYEEVSPEEKTQRVGAVFSSVAKKYDVMNDAMSGGMHRLWKDRFVRRVKPREGEQILDMAGGTGDIAFRMAAQGASVTVSDINQDMLDVGIERAMERGFDSLVQMSSGIADRGMRVLGANIEESTRNGKADCLWADFTDTTATQGPVDKLTGRNVTEGGSISPDYLTPITRGPMKDRTFNIPDEAIEDFLVKDVQRVGAFYVNTMTADIEMARLSQRLGQPARKAVVAVDQRHLRDDRPVGPARGEHDLGALLHEDERTGLANAAGCANDPDSFS